MNDAHPYRILRLIGVAALVGFGWLAWRCVSPLPISILRNQTISCS